MLVDAPTSSQILSEIRGDDTKAALGQRIPHSIFGLLALSVFLRVLSTDSKFYFICSTLRFRFVGQERDPNPRTCIRPVLYVHSPNHPTHITQARALVAQQCTHRRLARLVGLVVDQPALLLPALLAVHRREPSVPAARARCEHTSAHLVMVMELWIWLGVGSGSQIH